MCIVIGGRRENLGLSVTVLRLHKYPIFAGGGLVHCGGDPFWEIDRPLTYTLTNGMPSRVPFSSDQALMPIRPEPDEQTHAELQTVSGELYARVVP
jgi:hypothetical protein